MNLEKIAEVINSAGKISKAAEGQRIGGGGGGFNSEEVGGIRRRGGSAGEDQRTLEE